MEETLVHGEGQTENSDPDSRVVTGRVPNRYVSRGTHLAPSAPSTSSSREHRLAPGHTSGPPHSAGTCSPPPGRQR